ncbi:GNAT family N-acetyltransferase [Burkholderia cenocepacia]|jgi:ribosomal protein S18 acetylase RimI-like enzyme|uniref:GNAT family N-acetyltransferase n=1 Tax=Burkholderia cenocepacia TaxID=95486 RepID=UPI000D0C6B33|nr:GNAT family N-acetyltransferase [Burkholderia cenocepacia]RQU98670.1 GNAT family N-acetyltransferase [Burkholderia cenocepacia]SOT40229.1 conserved hypothetical protein [Burkholderia cenocepacia]HDR9880348.1 GNAT family N-acetyltransferase [Burkholderia cenocepacia]HDR9887639.1 GNAT family N-acetyltransferase [Burkholderia cenocepacia]
MMLTLTSPATAKILESVEATHLARQIAAYARLEKRGESGTADVMASDTVAAITHAEFGRKLNHVTGLGMFGPVSSGTLVDLEARYAAKHLDIEIDLCPHCDASALAALTARNYQVNAFSNTYVRLLSDDRSNSLATDRITVLSSQDVTSELFVATSVEGFSAQTPPRSVALLETLARIAVARTDTCLFAATLDGTLAGTAAMSIIPTSVGQVAHLSMASTISAFRCRGVQAALLRARLQAARNSGCVAATITARPTNVSARNAERAGLTLAYTKATFVKRLCGGTMQSTS